MTTRKEAREEFVFENPVEAVGFAQLRHIVMLDRKLSDGAYRTFATYIKYAQQNPTCWPGIETIARDRGKSAATISRHNQELESLGYIRRQRRMGNTTLTIIRDLNQVPRLQELAIHELQEREHRKNERIVISKMQGKISQKRDVEEEPLEEESPKENKPMPKAKEPIPEPDIPLPDIEGPWKGPAPPAAKVYLERFNFNARKTLWRRIHETVGDQLDDLEFWDAVIAKYDALGWNPKNIDGMLEWYEKRELPKVSRGGGNGGGQAHAIAEIARVKREYAEQKMHDIVPGEYTMLRGEVL